MRPLAEAFCRVVFTTIRRGWWWHADATELFLPAGGGRVKRLSYIYNNRVLLCQAARFYEKIEETLCRSSKIFVWWSQRIKLTTLNRVAGACLLIRWYRLQWDKRWQKSFSSMLDFGVFGVFADSETLETVEHKTHVTGALMSKETMILRWHPRNPNWHSRLIAQLSLNCSVLCGSVGVIHAHDIYPQQQEQHVEIKFIHGTFGNHARNLVHRTCPKALD